MLNCNHETHALWHLKLSFASFKWITWCINVLIWLDPLLSLYGIIYVTLYILDFQNVEILGMERAKKMVEMRHHAKFRVDRSSRCWDMAIFQFFKMAAAAIFDFQNVQIIGVGRVKGVEMRHWLTTFRVDRSSHCWEMAIFRFFKRLSGFDAVAGGGRNFPIPTDLAIGLYNSLSAYYCISCENETIKVTDKLFMSVIITSQIRFHIRV